MPRSETLDDTRGIVAGMLDVFVDGVIIEQPADAEFLTGSLLTALAVPGLPPDTGRVLVSELEGRGDNLALAALAGLGLFALGDVGPLARAAAARLACSGVTNPVTHGLGTLEFEGATRLERDGAEVLAIVLRRPDDPERQVVAIGIDHQNLDGALVRCTLMPPCPQARARDFLDGIGASVPATPITVQRTRDIVATATDVAAQRAVGVSHEDHASLPVVALALMGSADGLPPLGLLMPWEDDDVELLVDPARDEADAEQTIAALLDEFVRHLAGLEPATRVMEEGEFVAACMLDWKATYADGLLGRWTTDDVSAFLIDHVPRKITGPLDTFEAFPGCVLAFCAFLDDRGSLSGSMLPEIVEVCSDLREPFLDQIQDPAGWGMAKSLAMQMVAEGVDESDPEAVQAWFSAFNERPRAERDRILGPSTVPPSTRPASPGVQGDGMARHPNAGPARAKRKAQRAARKRNRR